MLVVLSSYDSLVDRLAGEAEKAELRWVGRTDYANLKLKVATAIVAISSIHLLQVFMRVESYSREGVLWRMGITPCSCWGRCCSACWTASPATARRRRTRACEAASSRMKRCGATPIRMPDTP